MFKVSDKKKRYLITSALPYVNTVKHLGNLVSSLLPADILARYLRQRGEEVLAVGGTDDHGTPAEVSALEAGMPVEKFVEQMSLKQKDIYERFGLSYDIFSRTHTQENAELTQHLFLKLHENGYIKEKEVQSYLGNIVDCVQQMLGLINNLLDVDAIESGSRKLSFEKFDLIAPLQSIINNFMNSAKEKEINLIYTSLEGECIVFGDVNTSKQILENLISNAIKFTPKNETPKTF